jgi:putative membrane protein
MNLKHFLALAAAAGFAFLPFSAAAADDAENAGKTSGHLTMTDESFIRKAAQDGMTEAQLGGLAAQKAKREDVKRFGEKMMTDHTRINDTLKSLALQKGLTLQDGLDAVHAGVIDRISTLEGDQFDKAWIDEMVKGHKEAVGEFKGESNTVKDPELKAFVAKNLPVLKQHLQMIEKVANGSP